MWLARMQVLSHLAKRPRTFLRAMHFWYSVLFDSVRSQAPVLAQLKCSCGCQPHRLGKIWPFPATPFALAPATTKSQRRSRQGGSQC